MPEELLPPTAERRPTVRDLHGVAVTDDYAWLADRDDPAVLDHIEAENEHTDAVLAPLQELRDHLFEELRGRVRETDTSVPIPRGAWEVYQRTEEGQAYPIFCRRPRGGGDEQVLLDQNELSEGHDYVGIGDLAISPDDRLLAYTVDTDGSERHTLRIRDLDTGEDLPDVVDLVYYGVAWANDSRTLLYTSPDEAMRPWQIWRHRLGDEPYLDQLVVEETDERFFLGVWRARDDRWLIVSSDSRTTSEYRLVDAERPDGRPLVVEPREQDVQYTVETAGDRVLVLTNRDAPDFRVLDAAIVDGELGAWRELVPADPDVRWDDVDAMGELAVVHGRRRMEPVTLVVELADGASRELAWDGDVLEVGGSSMAEADPAAYRVEVESPVQPRTWLEIDLRTDERRELRRTPVVGVDLDRYVAERRWAKAAHGVEVPVTLVRHRDTPLDGTAALLVTAYGAYEIPNPAGFSHSRFSLLDRGVVVATAHVRGGGELGRAWWEQGRLGAKPTTFSDTIAVTEHLLAEGVAAAGRVALWGGSAGGLLVGATISARPDLYAAAVAEVPFVDVVNTMLDQSLPLTVIEWEEWGDPRDPDAYRTIAGYAPYEALPTSPPPAMLVTSGWTDPRVGYWEPTKWVAKLRATFPHDPDRPLLLKTELGAGHGGPSGRYDSWREVSLINAFLCWRLDVADSRSIT
ncbi:MAG: S9 family peptidase [Actinomycetota bacterium]